MLSFYLDYDTRSLKSLVYLLEIYMSLLDAFKPKWQNSNPERRLEAVEEMDAREQSTLERIALSDEESSVRTAAVKKLTLIPSLSAISKKSPRCSKFIVNPRTKKFWLL